MKNLIFSCLCAMLLLTLSACETSHHETSAPISPISVCHETKGVELSLGMSSKEVERALTSKDILPKDVQKPTEPALLWSAIYGNGEDKITILYDVKTDTVVQIKIEPSSKGDYISSWRTGGVISLGATKEELTKAYGDAEERNSVFSYQYDLNSNANSDNGTAIAGFHLDESHRVDYLYVINADPNFYGKDTSLTSP